MSDRSDMIEISLNRTTQAPSESKLVRRLSAFVKFNNENVARKRDENAFNIHSKSSNNLMDIIKWRKTKDACSIRQLYCPNCEQRLGVDNLVYSKYALCCLPLLPLSCMQQYIAQLTNQVQQVFCKKCGSDLGYMKSG